MKCWLHPRVDAVAVCKSCGKGLCKDCLISISSQSYCKECIEKGVVPTRVTTAPEAVPIPSGVPNKGFFIVGGIGSIMNVVAAILFFPTTFWLYDGWRGYRLDIINISATALIFIGILLAGIGYLGIRRNYGSSMGTASFAMGIVAGVFFIFELVVRLIAYSSYDYYYYYDLYDSPWYVIWVIAFLVTFVIFGVSQIIWGVTHIVTRKFVNPGLSLATGIVLIIAGSLTASILLSFVGIILFLAAEIMVTILFFISKVPTIQPQHSSS